MLALKAYRSKLISAMARRLTLSSAVAPSSLNFLTGRGLKSKIDGTRGLGVDFHSDSKLEDLPVKHHMRADHIAIGAKD